MTGIGSFSATDLATERIRELIASGVLPQGSKITIEGLASDLGVSRTPIRDAMGRLQNEGLIRVVPRVGVYVRQIGLAEVLEVYAIKKALEPVMAQWAAERASIRVREDFFQSASKLADLAASEDTTGYIELVVARRQQLLEMSDSQVLAAIFRSIDGRVRLLRTRNLLQPVRMTASAREHMAIARAVRAGDGPTTAERTRRHVQSAMMSISRLVQNDIPGDNES